MNVNVTRLAGETFAVSIENDGQVISVAMSQSDLRRMGQFLIVKADRLSDPLDMLDTPSHRE